MMELIQHCRHLSVDQILQLPDVSERIQLFQAHLPKFCAQLRRCSNMRGSIAVMDLRREEPIYAGNRFVIYALYPECNASVHVIWGLKKQNTVLAVGKSILNRTNPVDIGQLMLSYGGGGHAAAGTCQIPHGDAERVLDEIIAVLNHTTPCTPAVTGPLAGAIPVSATRV
jgi:nanoRNase/pAp phosphatase (c-di-AMP/oligoRNAs hydrolase)